MGNFKMFPQDIMLDIFSRLPVEFLLECKLVSKPWRDLVRHQSLARLHLKRLNDSGKLSCIFFKYEPKIKEFHYSEYDENSHDGLPFSRTTMMNLSPPFRDYSFVGSCNGLICFNARVEQKIGVWKYGPAYICNPITRECIILPKLDEQFMWTGFGYIPETNEYKVVRIYIPKKRYLNEEEIGIGVVQVYTLGSTVSGWRNVGKTNINMQRFSHRAAAFANGALYWEEHHGTTILAFCLADEKIIQLPAPPPYFTRPDASYFSIKFGVLGNFLSVTYEAGGDCDIWLLKRNEDNGEFNWIKAEISQQFEFTNNSGRLLCYGNNRIYYSYDPKALSAKIDISFGKSVCEAIPHKNTLVSLKLLGEKDTKMMEFVEIISSSEETENGD